VKISPEDICEAVRFPKVAGAWLFGSARDGEVREGSDVDVAVLFAQKPDLDDLAECRARLQKALCFDDIDVVPLNGASPMLGFEALCGRRVYCADEDLCAEFASLTAREYEDEMAMCERWVAAGGGPGRA
jgi:predicted nucleotidyltransferase